MHYIFMQKKTYAKLNEVIYSASEDRSKKGEGFNSQMRQRENQ